MSTRPVAERLGTQSYTVTKRSSPFLDLVFLLKTPSLGRRFDCVTRRYSVYRALAHRQQWCTDDKLWLLQGILYLQKRYLYH